MYIKQYVKKTVSCIAIMAVMAVGTAEAQVSQMMRPSELGGSGRTGVSQQRVPKSDSILGSGSVLDLNQTTNNPLLDKLQEQGNAGTTQSGTSGSGSAQSGSGTEGASSATGSTATGPTLEAAESLRQSNQQISGAMNPFAQFEPTQTNQKQETGSDSSYFGIPSSMDALAQVNHTVQEKQAAQQEAKIQDALKNGPTIDAANTINQINGNTSENPFAAFDQAAQNGAPNGIGSSYFGSNPMDAMKNVQDGVADAAVQEVKMGLGVSDGYQHYESNKLAFGYGANINGQDTDKAIYISESDTSLEAVEYRNAVSEMKKMGAQASAAEKAAKEAAAQQMAAEKLQKAAEEREKALEESIKDVDKKVQDDQEKLKTAQDQKKREALLKAQAKTPDEYAKHEALEQKYAQEEAAAQKALQGHQRELNEAKAGIQAAQKEAQQAEKDKAYYAAQQKKSELEAKDARKAQSELTQKAKDSAMAYVQKNPDAVISAEEAVLREQRRGGEERIADLKKAGWELDENGNILANEHNKALYMQKGGNTALTDAGFAISIRDINNNNMSAQDLENKLKLANALESLQDEKNGQTSLLEGLSNSNGEIDVNHLTPEQVAALERVQSWREQNEKRKAAGLPPVSFEDYVHRGGLSQDVIIYREAKLPKIKSMAGQWHQAVDVMSKEEKANRVSFQKRLGDKDKRVKMRQLLGDKDKRVKMQKQLGDKDKRVKMRQLLGDTGYAVKQKSESNERQVESNFK